MKMDNKTQNIFKYWPFKDSKPRISQVEVLNWMESLPSDVKYILCEAPVGAGKSPLALNYSGFASRSFGDAFILTPQKILQKQYEDSFDPSLLASLYGKANYSCETKNTNCDVGSAVNPQCSSCPYKAALVQARVSPNIVLNYRMALLLFKYVSGEQGFRRRKLIVFDEAHTLENHLTEFNAVQIGERRCKQFNIKWEIPKGLVAAFEWATGPYRDAVLKKKKELFAEKAEIEERTALGESMSKADIETINRAKDVAEHLESLGELALLGLTKVSERYVFVPDKTHFRLKEIYGKNVFNEIVKPMGEKFLFLSSTILDKDSFCEDLGINPKEAAFISMDSEFPQENRPILYMPKAKMTYGWDGPDRQRDRKELLEAMIEIISHHKDDNGIIHTASFQIAKWLVENLEGKVPHRILHHNPDSGFQRESVIMDYMEDDLFDTGKKILISPSITEGLDLKDSAGRFAIFAKIPYPYLGDAWVKRRMELSQKWYSRQALTNIIQGGGRVVRTPVDWGNVYILDESFSGLLKQTKNIAPKWWLDSIERI